MWVAMTFCLALLGSPAADTALDPAITTVYPVKQPRGLMVTTGGWAYCEQVRKLARRTGYTLVCGTFYMDGYLGLGLRSKRHVDWGNPEYLASYARKIEALRARIGGELILIGVSYSGFGVATLASHHPELRPSRVIVIDSYLDLVNRRTHAPNSSPTAREIDGETGGILGELEARSVSAAGLAEVIRQGARVSMMWSVSPEEASRYRGATCDETASASTLAKAAALLRRPIPAWVTESRHGTTLWHFGDRIMAGRYPGTRVVFRPDGVIPNGSTC